jgi:citrate synthase
MDRTLTAAEVAERLGVELATVYAYASRGALTRRPGPGRSSRYDADEVELLARKGRPRSARRRPGAIEVVIGTTVCEIGDGWVRYRGHDLVDLAGWATYEDACELLWTGEIAGDRPEVDRERRTAVGHAAARATATLPAEATISARLAVGVAAASPLVPRATTVERSVEAATLVIDAMIAALPLVTGAEPDGAAAASVVARLWPRLSPQRPTPRRLRALDTALVVLAEHELATSTLAVRVAASTRARPAEAVLAGIGTMSGPLHGRAAVRVHRRLVEGLGPATDDDAAGFGHPVHEHGDPRFALLLEQVLPIASPRRRERIEAYAHGRAGLPAPNVDAALGGLGYAIGAEPGATESIFAIARTAGWLAHAFEEADELPVRFRGRTLYRGPR